MNIIIGGCVKNCESYIKDVFNNIHIISNSFNVIKIICSFDTSSDKSLLELCKQKRTFHNLEIIINKEPITAYRTINISNARNRILDYIEQNNIIADYLIMMDFDDVSRKELNIEVLKNAFKIKEKWDILTFMNEKYYDYWALSIDNFIFSCWHNNNPRYIIKNMRDYLYKKINGALYIECKSAFNGFGIFKLSKIRGIKYNSITYTKYYVDNFIQQLKIIENITNTKYNLNEVQILDCEHRMYQILCKEKNNAKNVIFNEYLFPRYDGEHASFLD